MYTNDANNAGERLKGQDRWIPLVQEICKENGMIRIGSTNDLTNPPLAMFHQGKLTYVRRAFNGVDDCLLLSFQK